jgi:DNA repair exonuclease SbcCD nuclease subunit
MKFAIVSDTHFGARGDSAIFNEYFYKFWENVFFPYLEEHNIKTLVHLGDVVDRRRFINHYVANDFQNRFMRRLWKDNIDTHILIGNHDTYYKGTNRVNAIDNLCKSYDGVHEPHIYVGAKVVEFDSVPILFVPWICDDNVDETMALIESTSSQILMGHLEIAGFEMDRGNICHEGLDRKVFDKFDVVLSGHFHHKSTHGNITYLGNQYEMTWMDYNDPRGFHIFDTDTRELTFVENPYKMFYKIIYDDKADDIMTIANRDLSQYRDTYVKVVVLNKTNPYLFDSFMSNLYQVNPADITIAEDIQDLTTNSKDDTIDEAEDTITIINKVVDSLENTDINSDRFKSILRELYVEAINLDSK